jgi:hypothetical protein
MFTNILIQNTKALELKNKGIKITIGNKEYELKFDMNTFCELEGVYGDINVFFFYYTMTQYTQILQV